MNVEMFFVGSGDRSGMMACIEERLLLESDPPGIQPDWGLESSYDILLAKEPKRKIALSPVQSGWIAAIESKEVLDFALLQMISERLACEVVACQLANVIDSCGFARCFQGKVADWNWLESDVDPLRTLRAYLASRSVPFDLLTFREAVQLTKSGWKILKRR